MPGSTNFKQWDEAIANIQSDAAYLAEVFRTGGAAPGIFPKEVFNKLSFQTASMVAALAEMMAAKGYVVEDGSAGTVGHDYNALKAVLANIITVGEKIPAAATADNSLSLGGIIAATYLQNGGGTNIYTASGWPADTTYTANNVADWSHTPPYGKKIVCNIFGTVNGNLSYVVLGRSSSGWFFRIAGGNGTLPADPATPNVGKISVAIRNNHTAAQGFDFYALYI